MLRSALQQYALTALLTENMLLVKLVSLWADEHRLVK